jgi:hypothetical protein
MSVLDLVNKTGLTGLQRFLGGGKSTSSLPKVNFYDRTGSELKSDHRVRIQVPPNYVVGKLTSGGTSSIPPKVLTSLKGIVFPYTPQINIEHKADYSPLQVTHSNFSQHFYRHSSVGTITITGQFSVQNDSDAEIYLSTVHLLRALTKMLVNGEPNSGSPPPVCRLFAYGSYMIENVPVAVTSFRTDLPEKVDYFAISSKNPTFESDTMVPTLSSITVSMIPMYSRKEQQQFKVADWLNGGLKGKGYL